MKLFVLLSRFPYPLEKGDKLRAFHQIKELSKQHEIVLCALSDQKVAQSSIDKLQEYCKAIHIIRLPKWKIYWNLFWQLLFTDKSLQVVYFYNKSAQKKITKLIQEHQPDHIYCQLIRVTEYVKNIPIPKTLDYMDALARGMERRIALSPFYIKWFLTTETTRLKRYEHQIFDTFDNLTIISEQDKNLIVHIKNDAIQIIPNGVDYEMFKFQENCKKKYDLIFTGNMAYPPNIDSVIYLVNEVMPLVWKKYPTIKLVIAGAEPDKKVLQLASENVEITGWVKDITTYYAAAKIFVAPMQIGTGLQNKLLEAMAMQIPCVTSQLANNALGAEHQNSILIGNQPEEYCEHIISLLENKNIYNNIATTGYDFVKKNYTWEGTTEKLNELIINTKKKN